MPLLSFEWADRVWIPTVMVFGLSSAPHFVTQFVLGHMKAIKMSTQTLQRLELDNLVF